MKILRTGIYLCNIFLYPRGIHKVNSFPPPTPLKPARDNLGKIVSIVVGRCNCTLASFTGFLVSAKMKIVVFLTYISKFT